jgi:hypothetical protein
MLAVLACLASTAAVAVSAADASLVQRSGRSCTPPKYPGSGYFTGKIRVTNISCAYGKKFVVSYYRCRIHAGGAGGRCRTRVSGFTCTEVRNSIPTEVDARVTCRRGTQRIVHTYQQNIE